MDVRPSRWNDDRLDEFARNVDRRFDKVESELGRVNDRVDRVQHSLVMGFLAMGTMMFAGFGAMITLFVTHF
jgi:hypothetical protein